MELLSAFQLALSTPVLSDEAQFSTLLKATGLMSPTDIEAVAKHLVRCKGVTIKKLLTMLDMARQDEDGNTTDKVDVERFLETAMEWGL
jgi:hypothetical protein